MRGQLVFNKEFNCSDTLTNASCFDVLWRKPLSVVKPASILEYYYNVLYYYYYYVMHLARF